MEADPLKINHWRRLPSKYRAKKLNKPGPLKAAVYVEYILRVA